LGIGFERALGGSGIGGASLDWYDAEYRRNQQGGMKHE
jgi:hypothetical protein